VLPEDRKIFVKDSYESAMPPAESPQFCVRKSLFAYRSFVRVIARFTVHSLQFYDERGGTLRTATLRKDVALPRWGIVWPPLYGVRGG